MHPYRLPLHVDRSAMPLLQVTNIGDELLRGVRADLLGPGVLRAPSPAVLPPGETLRLLVLGEDLARDTRLVLRWIRPDGEEYLWSLVF